MSVIKVFFIFFTLVSIVHVTAIFLRKGKLRRVSKIFIVPPLLAAYIAGQGSPLIFPVLALLFGWLGDALLLRINEKAYFRLGLASFLLGHVCYIVTFIECLGLFGSGGVGRFSVITMAVFIPIAIIIGVMDFRFLAPPEEMFYPVALYMIVIEIMAFWGLEILILYPMLAGFLIFAGALCFMISDTILAYYTFRKLTITGAVLIMVLYIMAQAGIVIGLLLLNTSVAPLT
jgi:uncharacterized membrane protein YhhN